MENAFMSHPIVCQFKPLPLRAVPAVGRAPGGGRRANSSSYDGASSTLKPPPRRAERVRWPSSRRRFRTFDLNAMSSASPIMGTMPMTASMTTLSSYPHVCEHHVVWSAGAGG